MSEAATAAGGSAGAARAATFVRERFPPGAYGTLILAFVACGTLTSAAAIGRPVALGGTALAAIIVTLAFLRMRLLDEVKDLEVDRLGRPWRPLPRGLVSTRELEVGGWLALAGMTAAAAALGPTFIAVYVVAAVFLVAAGADFGAGAALRRRRLGYALAHSPAVPLLLAVVWLAQPGAVVDGRLGWLLLVAWGGGLGAEIGRKTVAPDEERPYVETYSEVVGQSRAVLLAALALTTAVLGTAGFAMASAMPVPVVGGLLVLAACVLVSWRWLRRTRGRTLTASSGVVALLVLLLPPILTLLVR